MEKPSILSCEFVALVNARVPSLRPEQAFNFGTATSVVLQAYTAGDIDFYTATSMLLKIAKTNAFSSKELGEICAEFGEVTWIEAKRTTTT